MMTPEPPLLRRTITAHLSDDEHALYLATCKRLDLDPFARYLWIARDRGQFRIESTIDGFRFAAERTGEIRRADWAALVRTRWSLESGLDFEPTAHRRAGRNSALRFPQAHLGQSAVLGIPTARRVLGQNGIKPACQMRRGSGIPQGVPGAFRALHAG